MTNPLINLMKTAKTITMTTLVCKNKSKLIYHTLTRQGVRVL